MKKSYFGIVVSAFLLASPVIAEETELKVAATPQLETVSGANTCLASNFTELNGRDKWNSLSPWQQNEYIKTSTLKCNTKNVEFDGKRHKFAASNYAGAILQAIFFANTNMSAKTKKQRLEMESDPFAFRL